MAFISKVQQTFKERGIQLYRHFKGDGRGNPSQLTSREQPGAVCRCVCVRGVCLPWARGCERVCSAACLRWGDVDACAHTRVCSQTNALKSINAKVCSKILAGFSPAASYKGDTSGPSGVCLRNEGSLPSKPTVATPGIHRVKEESV